MQSTLINLILIELNLLNLLSNFISMLFKLIDFFKQLIQFILDNFLIRIILVNCLKEILIKKSNCIVRFQVLILNNTTIWINLLHQIVNNVWPVILDSNFCSQNWVVINFKFIIFFKTIWVAIIFVIICFVSFCWLYLNKS